MKYTRNNYIISIKLLTILILLINCSSNKKDNETIISSDIEIYKSGLSSLRDSDYSKAVKIINSFSI